MQGTHAGACLCTAFDAERGNHSRPPDSELNQKASSQSAAEVVTLFGWARPPVHPSAKLQLRGECLQRPDQTDPNRVSARCAFLASNHVIMRATQAAHAQEVAYRKPRLEAGRCRTHLEQRTKKIRRVT